jgi:5-methylcytosine-specific restriction endonuclease McrA
MSGRVYGSTRWQRLRKLVLERDGYQCRVQGPGCTGVANAVDHIVSLTDGGDPFSLMNLRASCTHCNSARVHVSKLGKVGVSPSREW